MSLVLESPKNCKDFEGRNGQKWAREIIVDYYTRTEEGWLLGPLVKMLSVIAKENPSPGGLSRSYCLEVFYKIGETMTQEHWFVKIPKGLQTVAMDERELVMYNTIFPRLQVYLSETLYEDEKVDLPIPIIYFSSFLGDGVHDFLVTENLCSNRYFQVDNDTTKLAYMRAAMTALANIHGITFSFMKSLGGKEALLAQFPTIKEQLLPKDRKIRREVNKYVQPYLLYLANIKPDISQQIQVLSKFHKFLYKVYSDLQDNEELMKLKTLVHGDSKLDNFLFKKEGYGEDEKYSSMLIDWQGCGFDLVSNDLMWCLYGFIKNLPETGEMIHGFVEYSLVTYWDSLKAVFKAFGDKCTDFSVPEESEWAAELIKEGFTLEFMKNAIIRPVLSLQNKDLLYDWFEKVTQGSPDEPPPPESEIFKTENSSNFIYLFFKIGTEVNVFSHLGKVLFMHMKEAMFSDNDPSKESDDEDTQANSNDKQADTSVSTAEEDTGAVTELTTQQSSEDPVENGIDQPATTSSEQLAAAVSSLLDNLNKCVENVKSIQQLQQKAQLEPAVEDGQVVANDVSSTADADWMEKCGQIVAQIHQLEPALFTGVKPDEPKTVTSMYGKVYKLKNS